MQAVLHNERLKTAKYRHPWVYSRAIRRFSGNPQAGDMVTLVSEDNEFLGRGMWNHQSSIRMRMLTWKDEPIDEVFWEKKLRQAIAGRGVIPPQEARRLVNAENDYLAGLVVDQYGDWLVLQALTVGIDQRKHIIAQILYDILKPQGIYERSDSDARLREGMTLTTGLMLGKEPPDMVEIIENGHRFMIDIRKGHKTGFYLDQRDNRRILAEHITQGARVLNNFAYTGGFSVYAYQAGASEVVSVDSSVDMLNLADQNLTLNGFPDTPLIAADVFQLMRHYREQKEKFDVIILDPPKFAKSINQVDDAVRGYRDINRLAWQLLREGGLLMTYSCSGTIDAQLFRQTVFTSLDGTGKEAQVLRQLSAPADHPVAITFPEGAYLKGLLCRAI